jgi:hypothetical protein
VADILGDPGFWIDLPKLNKLQEPLTKVITMVQSNRTTLADVCRWVLYLQFGLCPLAASVGGV